MDELLEDALNPKKGLGSLLYKLYVMIHAQQLQDDDLISNIDKRNRGEKCFFTLALCKKYYYNLGRSMERRPFDSF